MFLDGGLLDLSVNASSSATDPWSTVSLDPTIILRRTVDSGVASRGGWSLATVLGDDYRVTFDIGTSASTGGSYVRVSPDDLFGAGNAIANSGHGSKTGTLDFVGTGGTVWIGPALVIPDEQTVEILAYSVANLSAVVTDPTHLNFPDIGHKSKIKFL